MLRPSLLDGEYKHDVLAQREIWHHFFNYGVAIGSKRRLIQEIEYFLIAKSQESLGQIASI